MGIVLNHQITLDKMVNFIMLSYLSRYIQLEIFPTSDIFFDFFLWGLEVLVIQIFQVLGKDYRRQVMLFLAVIKGDVFLLSFSTCISFVYKKGYQFLRVNFVSSHFTRAVYQLYLFSENIWRPYFIIKYHLQSIM